jgi:hypothetical protein
MSIRSTTALLSAFGIIWFGFLRPNEPTAGSDCELLSMGLLREPVTAISSVVIVVAGWVVARHRVAPGVTLLLAGAASVASHATAHPTARALDGVLAVAALAVIVGSILSDRPDRTRLGVAVVFGSIGIVIWVLTRTGAALCDVVGPWGHATWHLLVATAVVVTFVPVRRPTDG